MLRMTNDADVGKMLFVASADDSSRAKYPRIVNTLMGLTSDSALALLGMHRAKSRRRSTSGQQ